MPTATPIIATPTLIPTPTPTLMPTAASVPTFTPVPTAVPTPVPVLTAVTDTTAPVVTSVSVSPTNVSSGEGVTMTISASDAASNVGSAAIEYYKPNGSAYSWACDIGEQIGSCTMNDIDTTAGSGPLSLSGTYVFKRVRVSDQYGNQRLYGPSEISVPDIVVSATPTLNVDTDGPVLNSVSISPTTGTSGTAFLATIEAYDPSGVSEIKLVYHTPGSHKANFSCFTNQGELAVCTRSIESGNSPPLNFSGTYTFDMVFLRDSLGNVTRYHANTTAAQPFNIPDLTIY